MKKIVIIIIITIINSGCYVYHEKSWHTPNEEYTKDLFNPINIKDFILIFHISLEREI